MKSAKDAFIANKIREVNRSGVRRNTHKPVSSSNPRRAVSNSQAIAIAYSEARRKGLK